MSELWVSDGVAHKVKQLWAHDGVVPHAAKEVWTHDGTAPRKWSPFAVLSLNYNPVNTLGSAAPVVLTFGSDGSVVSTNDITGNWGTPTTAGIGANYWVNLTVVSGTGTMNGTTAAWLSIGSPVTFRISAAPFGQIRTKNCTYQIAADSVGSVIVASGTAVFISDNS